ncbi:MAG: lipoprotein insertase outer membrane protein LolB [Buchnera aphidicola (Chaetogeoica yunlongensis)]
MAQLQYLSKILILNLCIFSSSCCTTNNLELKKNNLHISNTQKLKKFKRFYIQGYIILYFTNKIKFFGRLYLQQFSSNNYLILLINPIGQISLKCYIKKNKITIFDHTGKIKLNKKSENELLQETGFNIPFTCLNQWMFEMPGKSKIKEIYKNKDTKLIKYIYLKKIWNITYSYNTTKKSLPFPKKIFIQNNSIYIKIYIYNGIIR